MRLTVSDTNIDLLESLSLISAKLCGLLKCDDKTDWSTNPLVDNPAIVSTLSIMWKRWFREFIKMNIYE